jgi:ubiquinone/menaquinone biosynthesis C-methylase UbiE
MKSFLNPESVLKKINLKSDMRAADFGSGSGGWVIPLAKKLENGKVFAIDILEEPLSVLRSKLKSEKLDNVETIQSNIESLNGSKMFPESCDLVLMTNLLFQAEDKKTIFEEAKRILSPKGRILVVDWKTNQPFGPKILEISSDDIKKIAKNLSLKVVKEFEAGPCHWALVLVK